MEGRYIRKESLSFYLPVRSWVPQLVLILESQMYVLVVERVFLWSVSNLLEMKLDLQYVPIVWRLLGLSGKPPITSSMRSANHSFPAVRFRLNMFYS